MTIEPQPPIPDASLPVADENPTPPVNRWKNLVAPVWHLVLIIAILLTFSFLGSSPQEHASSSPYARFIVYGGTFLFELVIVLLIWFWMRRSGHTMSDLIGGRWTTVESFLLDVAIAIGFLMVANFVVLLPIRIALGVLDLHHPDKQVGEVKRMLGHLIPRNSIEAGFFVVLAMAAGLFEEIIFRGYLQRQFSAIARNAYLGIAASAIIFGLSHGYQGGRMMIVIGAYGAMFGLLAHFRKSLRPGMIAHAMQDALSGIVLYFIARH